MHSGFLFIVQLSKGKRRVSAERGQQDFLPTVSLPQKANLVFLQTGFSKHCIAVQLILCLRVQLSKGKI